MESLFFNRELSWLEFNSRVLNQALNKNLPIMERIRFLSIVTSNFDEFFQVRVASVKRMLVSAPRKQDVSGLTPKMLLQKISKQSHKIIHKQHECLLHDIIPSLATEGIVYTPPSKLTAAQNEYIQNFFQNEIFPLLTPLRTDTEELHISNLKIYAAFLLKPIESINYEKKERDDLYHIALLPIPASIKNIVWLPTKSKYKNEKRFVFLNNIIEMCAPQLFPGFTVAENFFFKVARDADFAVDEYSGSDFIGAMENVLVKRQSSFAVQMMCTDTSPRIKEFLRKKLELSEDDVYTVSKILFPDILTELQVTNETEQEDSHIWRHFYPVAFPHEGNCWDVIKQGDVMLHVPYESYEPVVKFITDAAEDPNVLAIKITLYRTGNESPIVAALEKAAQNGKQVTVLVELKARFDEGRNIAWAEELEQAGAIVVYGLVNLKVHAKILMIIRREEDTLNSYVHLSTGNYNSDTAKLYSDLSIFTANKEMANDATIFFNLVTGYSTFQSLQHLSVAPVTLKNKILFMIKRETEHAKSGNGGLIIAKMNSLAHEEIITALYKASCAGVKIMLNIRGICMLVPGIENMSENISVISIVDKYLEHSRIFYFGNNNSPELYLSSADWMPRNLDRRVELMFPILDKKIFADIKNTLDIYFTDNTNSYTLESDGRWTVSKPKKKVKRAQEILYDYYKKISKDNSSEVTTEFKVRKKN